MTQHATELQQLSILVAHAVPALREAGRRAQLALQAFGRQLQPFDPIEAFGVQLGAEIEAFEAERIARIEIALDAGRQLPGLAGELPAGEISTPATGQLDAGQHPAGETGQLPAGYADDDMS